MKSKYSILGLALLFMLLISCNDDNEVKVQNQNGNQILSIMDAMSAEMDTTELKGDADDDFATLIIVHHQYGIDMGMKQIAKGDDSQLKIMAKKMIDMQQLEMDKLAVFLVEHDPKNSVEGQQWGVEAEAAMTRMKNDIELDVLTGNPDHDFAVLMIHHYYSASDMAHALLQLGHHDEVKEIANNMIKDQNAQIVELQNWLLQNRP